MGKSMKKYFKTFTYLLAILLILLSQASNSETFKAGVSPGDTFTYTFNVFWSSPNPSQAPPASLTELNTTELVKIIVHEVQGPLVVMNMTTRFKNGTENKAQIWVNLLSGEGDGFGFIIAPNLGANSVAYHMGIEKGYYFILREELVKEYPFGKRTVLHATVNKTSSEEYILMSHDMYFDKETGVMFEWLITQVPQYAPEAKVSLIWRITEFHVTPQETQSQNPPTQGALTIAIIVITALLLFIVVFVRKRKIRQRKFRAQ